jgi:hypothetical protein
MNEMMKIMSLVIKGNQLIVSYTKDCLHVFQRKILAIGQVQGGEFSSLCFMDKMTSDEGKSGKPCLLSLKENNWMQAVKTNCLQNLEKFWCMEEPRSTWRR